MHILGTDFKKSDGTKIPTALGMVVVAEESLRILGHAGIIGEIYLVGYPQSISWL